MLHIIPIQDKEKQKELAGIFGVIYDERSFSYVAQDDELDGTVNSYIGFMQFRLCDTYAEVGTLSMYGGKYDSEAMQIMARTAFSFMGRIGIHDVHVQKPVSEMLMTEMKMTDMGEYYMLDLVKYFTTKCGDR